MKAILSVHRTRCPKNSTSLAFGVQEVQKRSTPGRQHDAQQNYLRTPVTRLEAAARSTTPSTTPLPAASRWCKAQPPSPLSDNIECKRRAQPSDAKQGATQEDQCGTRQFTKAFSKKGDPNVGSVPDLTAWVEQMLRDEAQLQVPTEAHVPCPKRHTATIPAPAGIPAPTPNTGEAYIRQSDGTPELKRSLNFTASIEENAGREPITMVRSTNPDYVTDQAWKKLHAWVHNWILQRIPEEHQHQSGGGR
jgi:hypothetical protein